jgi:hypothetical protein
LAAAVGLMLSLASQAAGPSRFEMTFDDDALFPPRNHDWNYTGGFSLGLSGAPAEQMGISAPTCLLDSLLLGWSGALECATNVQHSFIFAGIGYTPHDIANEAPIYNDRPYSSVIFVSGRIRRLDDPREPTWSLSSELSGGMLGLGLFASVQTVIHKLSNGTAPPPMGWSHQISDGGEPTLEYRVAADSLLLRQRANPDNDWLQASIGGEVAVGYNTYGWAGGLLKLGWTGHDYGAPNSIIGPLAGRSLGAMGRADGAWEGYVFGRAGGYAVAYNALLQGQFRHSDVTYSWSQVDHFVSEAQVGVVLRISQFSLVYAVTYRSSEFDAELAAGQYFGTATISWSWDF